MVIVEDSNCATLCGGTQINLKFILTAAHCIDSFKKDPRKMCPKKINEKKIKAAHCIDQLKNNPRKICPKKIVKPYPNNIFSKYVLVFCNYTGKKSTYHNHRDNTGISGFDIK